MKTNEIRRTTSPSIVSFSRLSRRAERRPGLKAAALGLACVVGVFALLAALYSIG